MCCANVPRAGVEGATYGTEARAEKCAVLVCRSRPVERAGVPQVEGMCPGVEMSVRSALCLFDWGDVVSGRVCRKYKWRQLCLVVGEHMCSVLPSVTRTSFIRS